MKVSISKAASLVGITRATLYRHIEKKGITVLKDEDNNPKIDVSELLRVYGDQVKLPNQPKKPSYDFAEQTQDVQKGEASDGEGEAAGGSLTPSRTATPTEVEVMRERIRHYEAEKQALMEERRREREQLEQQIENLRTVLTQSQDQQKRLTLLLTDQSEPSKKGLYPQSGNDNEARKIETMRDTVQRLENQNKRIYFELQKHKNKKFFQRVFGT